MYLPAPVLVTFCQFDTSTCSFWSIKLLRCGTCWFVIPCHVCWQGFQNCILAKFKCQNGKTISWGVKLTKSGKCRGSCMYYAKVFLNLISSHHAWWYKKGVQNICDNSSNGRAKIIFLHLFHIQVKISIFPWPQKFINSFYNHVFSS